MWSNIAVLWWSFALQGRQNATINAKFSKEEYTICTLLHAKTDPDPQRGMNTEFAD